MILVIVLLSSFLLGLSLFTRKTKAPPTPETIFLPDFHSGSYREIDPVNYLGSNTRHKPDSRHTLDNLFGSRSSGAHPERRPYREISPAFCSQEDSAELKLVTCVACTERWLESYTFSTSCHHRYCPECLTVLFEHAVRDESMYPPRCCGQVIPLRSVRSIITSELAINFATKAKEYGTVDRTYCVNPTCRKFIPAEHMSYNHAGCTTCGTSTCSRCKKKYHSGHCLPDENTEKLLKLAKKKKWQSCSSCHRLVEKTDGCNHMR